MNEGGLKEVMSTNFDASSQVAQVKIGMRSVAAWERFGMGDICNASMAAEK